MVLVGASRENVAERLKLYEKIRKNRASLMQIFSNAGQDEPELIRKDASRFMPIEKVPSKSRPERRINPNMALRSLLMPIQANPEEYFNHNFGYDVVQDTLNHLKDLDPSFELPEMFFQKKPGRGMYP